MNHVIRMTGRRNSRFQNHDGNSLVTVLEFSLTGLLGCLVSQAPLDGAGFTLVSCLLILASAPIAALTALMFGDGE
jgi:hypothetical protein